MEAISRIKKKEQLTKINIQLGQEEIKQGELLRVSATLSDLSPEIWLRILNKDNVIVQKAGLVAKNQRSFHILIGTKDLDKEQYTIQVSTNKSFTPMGFGQFTVKGDVPFLVPLLALGVGSNPQDNIGSIKKKPTKDDIKKNKGVKKPKKLQILKVKFKTMMDSRVDAACKIYENRIYEAGDKSMPNIPIHFNCRCHYEILDIRKFPIHIPEKLKK